MGKGTFWVYQLLIVGAVVPLAVMLELRPSPLAIGLALLAIGAMAYGAKGGHRGVLFVAGLLLIGSGVSLLAGKAGSLPALAVALLGLLGQGLLLRDVLQPAEPSATKSVDG